MKLLDCSAGLLVLLAAVCTAVEDPCMDASSQDSCEMCISASHLCSWCPYPPNVTADNNRCRKTNPSTPCPEGAVEQNPQAETVIIKDEPLTTNETQGDGLNSIQVSPQNISLRLRRGQPASFNMTFRSLRNSPLDIYFLIDISSSQNIVVGILQSDLPKIGEEVGKSISTNFQMGFGFFVDKPALPYAFFDYRTNSSRGIIMCRGFDHCVPTYSFRNSQPLISNITKVAIVFNDTSQLSSNIDSPEGGLEALLQVAVCTNETGWRPGALHMVFLITDQGYHLAGDGKLAGIVKPNDGLCHLEVRETGDMEYTHGLLQDYPSVFQVGKALERNLIVPVFTLRSSGLSETRVRVSLSPSYDRLVSDLDRAGTRAQAIVFDQSSVTEIIRVIRESYETTVQSIGVNQPTVPGYTITIDPIEGCNMSTDGRCTLQFDEEVTFRVTATLDDCTLAGSSTRQVELLGPPFSFTTIDLDPLCECDCTAEGPDVDSEFCSDRGNLACGLCACKPLLHFGDQCECDEEVTECPSARVNATTSSNCSDRGACSTCGTCRCFGNSFGDACQCVPTDCRGSCSNRGRCTCGETGSTPTCMCDIAPQSGFRFFERMVGIPGNCECDPDKCFNEAFPNELCHFTSGTVDGSLRCGCSGCNCPTGFVDRGDNTCTPEEGCTSEIETCIRCRLGDINNATNTACSVCPQNITFLGEDMEPANFSRNCDYNIGNCDYTIFIAFEGSMQVLSFTRLGCSNQALPWIITGSLVGAIILLGLLFLIILKLLLLAWDRHEYKKFTQELKDADFAPMDNPLYLNPQQDYQNPIRRPSRKAALEGLEEQQQQE